jgi:hypothetical protein
MTPIEALEALGATRIIWIDDHFADAAETLADMLINKAEVARSCNFIDIGAALTFREENDDQARQDLSQRLADLGQKRRSEIKDTFLAKQREVDQETGKELFSPGVEEACQLLGIPAENRWTFDGAEEKLASACAGNDEKNAYIIDMRDAASATTSDDFRGEQLLELLAKLNAKGTLFVLTHETTVDREAEEELRLRRKLGHVPGQTGIPICVIAKERLLGVVEPDMATGLCVAIKRAGLRRSMHEVLAVARNDLQKAFDQAEDKLLEIAPEQLDSFVVQKAYNEGASELHVVERALTASIGWSLRETFASDAAVQKSSSRLRALRVVTLPGLTKPKPEQSLQTFRDYETWESDTLLNKSLMPVMSGDVFEIDTSEAQGSSTKRYLLLGQACDMALRPGQDRDQDLAIFVPLKIKSDPASQGTPKKPVLPFTVDGKQLTCDFRNSSPVRLTILDLASFRADGKVRYDDQQQKLPQLLDGQAIQYASRCDRIQALIDHEKSKSETAVQRSCVIDYRFQLIFSMSDEFKHVRFGWHVPPPKTKSPSLGAHKVTWSLRRCGRVKAPYAGYLLDRYYDVMGRAAFDLDYTASIPE